MSNKKREVQDVGCWTQGQDLWGTLGVDVGLQKERQARQLQM